MTESIEYNGETIDEVSQIILLALRDENGDAPTSTLRKEAGCENNNSIHWRVRNYLGPDNLGFVEEAGTKPTPGAARPEIVYQLTDAGYEFIGEYESGLVDAISSARALESINRFNDRVDHVESEIERMDTLLNSRGTRLTRMESTLDEHESILNKIVYEYPSADEVLSVISDLNDLQYVVNDLVENLEETTAYSRPIPDPHSFDETVNRIGDSNAVEESDEHHGGKEANRTTSSGGPDADFEQLESRVAESFEIVEKKLDALRERQKELAGAIAGVDPIDDGEFDERYGN